MFISFRKDHVTSELKLSINEAHNHSITPTVFEHTQFIYEKFMTEDRHQVMAKSSMTLGIGRAKTQNLSEGDTRLYK